MKTRTTSRAISALLAVVFALSCLTACGSSSRRAETVARVGSTQITTQTLNYWMQTLFGEDYVATTAQPVPVGLVSEPASNSKCAARLEAGLSSTLQGRARPTSAQLFQKCQQLNALVRTQALASLISWQGTIQTAASRGIRVTDAEVNRRVEQIAEGLFPKPGELQRYLKERGWTLSVEQLRARLNLLSGKIHEQVSERGDERAVAAFYLEQDQRMTAKTTCKAGYVVAGCKGFKEAKPQSGLSPVALSQEIASLKSGTAKAQQAESNG